MNNMEEKLYTFWLCNIFGIGCKKIRALLECFGSAKDVFYSKKCELEQIRMIKNNDIDKIMACRNLDRVKTMYDDTVRKGIQFTYFEDKKYPKKLRNIADPPYGLFYKGNLPADDRPSVAVVGSRKVSCEGRVLAKKFGEELALHGISVVSGMALGVDIEAQRGALLAPGGKTYGILGNGVDICYPTQHIEEYMLMQENGGVISEFPLQAPSMPYHFPLRNRIISGLSDGILVIEARKGSGSLITAEVGLEQGKEIFVLPGSITNPQYEGGNELLKSGAAFVTKVGDILDGLGLFYDEDVCTRKKKNEDMLETTEKIVYAILSLEPLHISQIAQLCGLELQKVMEVLLSLQLKNYVNMIGGNYYIINL